jgi:branched-chain amino acid transport system substrate-binding protein
MRSLTKTIVAAILALPLLSGVASAYELTLPSFDYRTGPYAPNGIPFANGYGDYLNMLNMATVIT